MTPETQLKRNQLLHFIREKMESESAVKGVVAVGSIGAGTAHADSDIDAVVFLDPYDLYVVPAEAIWREEDDTFHSIFTSDESLLKHGLQLLSPETRLDKLPDNQDTGISRRMRHGTTELFSTV